MISRMRNRWSFLYCPGRAQPPLSIVLLSIFWSFCPQGTNSSCSAWGPSISCLKVTSQGHQLAAKMQHSGNLSPVRHFNTSPPKRGITGDFKDVPPNPQIWRSEGSLPGIQRLIAGAHRCPEMIVQRDCRAHLGKLCTSILDPWKIQLLCMHIEKHMVIMNPIMCQALFWRMRGSQEAKQIITIMKKSVRISVLMELSLG